MDSPRCVFQTSAVQSELESRGVPSREQFAF